MTGSEPVPPGRRRAGARLYCRPVAVQVIVLNGGSSSGKSAIARCLQAVLPEPWLVFGVDTLIEAMPAASRTSAGGSRSRRTARSPRPARPRGDRVAGMATSQAAPVHQGVAYDVRVDTTRTVA